MRTTPIPLLLWRRDLDDGKCEVVVSTDEDDRMLRIEAGLLRADTFAEAIELFRDVSRSMFGSADVECISTPIHILGGPLGVKSWEIDYDPRPSEVNGVRLHLVEKSKNIPSNED
jgi:hypothetical protein